MTKEVFENVKEVLNENNARFSTIAETAGSFSKTDNDEQYMGGICFTVQHYAETVHFVFDGSDGDFVNSIISALDKYTDLSKYAFVINGIPMKFSDEITEECGEISKGIINGLQNMTKAA